DALGEDLAGVLSLADRERAHRARIHGKRLRYLLEPFAASLEADTLVARLTRLQDDLGELRDAQALAELLARLLRKAKPDAVDGVKWLLERLGEREVEAWHAVVREWLEPAGADVVFGARQVAARLESRGAAAGLPLEIERKYLLSTLPPTAESAPWTEIRQGYLPGKVIVERLRLARDGDGDRYYRTVKTGRGVARVELEEEIDGRLFEALWPLTEGRRLEKRRHRVPDGDLTWEIDAFTDRPLVLAEVELPNEALVPAIPFWLRPFLLREVTGVPEYFNSSLAK
ncbi:MAG: CHAD domain-containing protein, partial [Gemmatimonadales bacterium]